MENTSFDEFKKLDLRIATVLSAERVEGSDKLLCIEVDLGDDRNPSGFSNPQDDESAANRDRALGRIRQLVAGIGKAYEPGSLAGKQIVVVANLEPRTIMGLESQGMLLAADSPEGPVLLAPDKEVSPGVHIR